MPRPGWVLSALLGWMLMLFATTALAVSSTFPDNPAPSSSSRWFGESSHPDFLPVDQAFKARAWRNENHVQVGMQSADGYYLYRHRFALESATPGLRLGPLQLPPGEREQDQWMGEVHIFRDRVVLSAPIEADAGVNPALLEIRLSYQGCAEAGLCYPPQHQQLLVNEQRPPAEFAHAPGIDPIQGTIHQTPAPQATAEPSPPAQSTPTTNDHYTTLLSDASLPWMLVLFLLAGLGLTFTPCVLPMLPIVTTLVVGQHATRGRALLLSASYVAGMASTYALLGTLTGLFGAGFNLQARLQSPWVLGSVSLLLVMLAGWLAEWFRLPALPGHRLRHGLHSLQHRLQQAGPGGAILAGALSTLVVSPCISAPLAGAMVYLSTTGNALHGGLALLALGLGMGIPLILVATLGAGWLPRSGAWLGHVRNAFALLMLALALWLVQRLLPASASVLLWGVLALCLGIGLGALRIDTPPGWPRLRQALALAVTVWGIACIIGAARGTDDPLRPLAPMTPTAASTAMQPSAPRFTTVTSPEALQAALKRAARQGRPALVDIYADWCISCREMERHVFPAARLAEKLDRFTLIRADVTDPAGQAILRNRQLFGPPALLFFDVDHSGHFSERRTLRTQGEVGIKALARLLDAVPDTSAK
ncbi:protein-disulfide reductase DsbD [Kushneria phosphatilytica]|nr:protein-disulfide reductase DsbD [Kushneria phosphatilytica]